MRRNQLSKNSKNTTSFKINRLANALDAGRPLTSQQAVTRFGYASVNSLTRAIATLRARGMRINTVTTRAGATAYQVA
jgi:predicted DNA-binding transcriptional regulator YafY